MLVPLSFGRSPGNCYSRDEYQDTGGASRHGTGDWIDLVKEQLRIAAGERLRHEQEDITLRGHAIECRINAENTEAGFLPSPGVVTAYHPPGGMGVRVDSSLYTGCEVTPFYDPMVAKVITWGRNRDEAIARMQAALEEMIPEGIHTSIPFHLRLLQDANFRTGAFHTRYIETGIYVRKVRR